MDRSWFALRWMRLPGRLALLLGMGALSAAGARADTAAAPPAGQSPSHGEVLIRTDGVRVYLSEGGRDFQELQLGDTAQARLVRQLLARPDGASGEGLIRLHPTILAGAGGAGFHWAPAQRTKGSAKPADGNPGRAGPPPRTGSAPEPDASRKATSGRTGDKG